MLAQKKELQERLEALTEELAQEQNFEVTLAQGRKVLDEFPVVWDSLEQEEQREVLRLLVEELKVHKTHVELKSLFLEPVTIPFALYSKKLEVEESDVSECLTKVEK